MKWFKHYTNAHKGELLQEFYAEFGVNEGHGLYFRLIEFLADKWDGKSEPRFRFLTKILKKYLEISPKKLEKFAGILTESNGNSFVFLGEFCEIYLPKLLEVRHRDALNASTRLEIVQHENGEEEEENRKDKKKRLIAFSSFLANLDLITKDTWNQKYGKDFVLEHGSEAYAYFANYDGANAWSKITWVSKIGSSLKRAKEHETKLERAGGIIGVVPD